MLRDGKNSMSEGRNGTEAKLPGFQHMLEAALFIGVIGGISDVSYIFTRSPDIVADLWLGLRFVNAGIFLTTVTMGVYLLLVLLVIRPITRSRKWTQEASLTFLYTLALLPGALIVGKTYAQSMASSSVLVEDVKVLFYFLKYIWIILPICWGMGFWLARMRVTTPPLVLYARFSALIFAVSIFLVMTPYVQQMYLLKQANVYSELGSRVENYLITVGVFALALLIWPLANLLAVKISKERRGALLAIVWVLFMVVPYIPALNAAGRLVGSRPSGAELSGRASNVILVSLDTVRYDDVGFNGSEVVETPTLDALASESIIYDRAITPMPMTGPAHISMLTGLQPDSESGHGVKSNGVVLADDVPTLGTILDESGYSTGAIIGGFPLARRASGIQRGFHYFHDDFQKGLRSRFLPDQVWFLTVAKIFRKVFDIREGLPHGRTKTADDVTDQALGWLEGNSEDPFFLFVHYFDAHWLYAPPPPYDTMYMPEYDGMYKGVALSAGQLQEELGRFEQADFDYMRALYRGEISFIDNELGRLIDWGNAEGRNLWDNTLLIVVSDHGESFEHEYYFNHTDRVYDQLIHIPMIVRSPDEAVNGGRNRTDALVNVSDIFYTVLDFLEVDTPESTEAMHAGILGTNSAWDHNLLDFSLNGSAEGTVETGWSFIPSQSYSFSAPGEASLGRFFTFRFPDWKLIYGPDAEPYLPLYQYFDLANDPEETRNIYGETDWTAYELPDIPGILASWTALQAASAEVMDPQVRAELKALGYIQEGAVAVPGASEPDTPGE